LLCAAAGGTVGCGGRPAEFDAVTGDTQAVGLHHAVVLGDAPLDRVLVLQSDGAEGLHGTPLSVGKNRASMVPDVSGERLLVLSAGIQPRRQANDELPSLSLIDTRGTPSVAARYELPAAFSALTLDPEGTWAVLAGATQDLVTNPNQLVLIDLDDAGYVPFTKTIRSFGSAPQSFQFTSALDVPGGARRFLIAETSHDLTLVDLEHLDRPEITIELPRTPSGAPGQPLDVVVDPGTDGTANDARLAIRLANDPNVVLIRFTPSDGDAGFALVPNLVDVGSPPSAIDFVTTDAGRRLAALVPGRSEATLIEPVTTQVEHLTLPSAFDRLRKVGADPATGGGDVALLWSQNMTSVAVWSLNRTSDQAFRSIDVLDLDTRVNAVLDVPGDTLGPRKLLQAYDSRFFVLDLARRQSFPMLSSGSLTLSVADDGLRAWAFAPGSPRLAKIDLASLEPAALQIERPISQVFDTATDDDSGRALFALHDGGARSVTLLNALDPDTAQTRFFPELLLGGE
jgi:hypothetical protein